MPSTNRIGRVEEANNMRMESDEFWLEWWLLSHTICNAGRVDE